MTQIDASSPVTSQLRRELGVFGAVMLGLGSMVGAGVFLGLGIGASIAGPAVVLAVGLAALVAACNGLSHAELAASHPVSGGTYEYGYKYLSPTLGFVAGWMWLFAQSAAAATAALGFGGYLLSTVDLNSRLGRMEVALAAVVLLTVLALGGVRLSNLTTVAMVTVTLGSLLFFVFGGIDGLLQDFSVNFTPLFPPPSAGISPARALFHATALMFVAYAGFGRITTLGEEVREPVRTIPRAILVTILAALLLYGAVALVAVGTVGADNFAALTADTWAPLQLIAAGYGIPAAGMVLLIGAMTAMLGVLLTLILGLTRMLVAMGRRRDMPVAVARIRKTGRTPEIAVVAVGVLVAALVLIGDISITWSFSAFAVLIYYAITNLAALHLPADKRLYPRVIPAAGLLACLFLAFWVDPSIWIAGSLLILVGIGWRLVMRRL